MNESPPTKTLFTIDETAERLGLHVAQLRRAEAAGELHRVGACQNKSQADTNVCIHGHRRVIAVGVSVLYHTDAIRRYESELLVASGVQS